MTETLGMNAKLYWAAAADPLPALAAMTEADTVRDVNVPLDSAMADITTRASGGFRSQTGTLKELKIEFEALVDPDDAFYVAVRDAANTPGATIALAALRFDARQLCRVYNASIEHSDGLPGFGLDVVAP